MFAVFLGPPGVGKGTQAKRASAEFAMLHLSTGDLLREHVKNASPLGQEARPYMERGDLVPDQLMVRMTIDRIQKPDCARGVLLDGFPRTTAQAEALDQALQAAGMRLDAVCFFNADDAVLVERMSGRRMCRQCNRNYHVVALPPKVAGMCDDCHLPLHQREDDRAESIRQRLEVYRRQSAGVTARYAGQGVLREFRAVGTVEEIWDRVRNSLAPAPAEIGVAPASAPSRSASAAAPAPGRRAVAGKKDKAKKEKTRVRQEKTRRIEARRKAAARKNKKVTRRGAKAARRSAPKRKAGLSRAVRKTARARGGRRR